MVVRASKELPSAKGGAEVASTEKAPPSRRIESTNHGRDRTARREGEWAADWSHGETRMSFQWPEELVNHKL